MEPYMPHERTADLPQAVPDKVEILSLVETALSWDLDSTALPPVEDALDMTKQFTDYGRVIADDLTRILSIAGDSHARLGAQATLSEAGRRLNLKPLARSAAPRSAAHRAQNLARLVQGLLRATHQVGIIPLCRPALAEEGSRGQRLRPDHPPADPP